MFVNKIKTLKRASLPAALMLLSSCVSTDLTSSYRVTPSYQQATAVCPQSQAYADELQDQIADGLEKCGHDCDAVAGMIADYFVMNAQSMNCEMPQNGSSVANGQKITGE